jgi:predicted NACHT family NTPase
MRRLPENKIRLYDMFVSLLCGGWDLAKGINRGSEFGQQPKLELARILAAFLHQCRKLEIDSTDMKLAMRQVLPHLESQGSAVLSEFVQDGLLVPVGDKHAFAHLSFQDYFAARDLMEPTGRRAELALSEYLAGDDWRKEVLAFYMGMLSRPNEAASWIKDKASEIARKVGSAIVEPRAEYLISVLPKRSGEEA